MRDDDGENGSDDDRGRSERANEDDDGNRDCDHDDFENDDAPQLQPGRTTVCHGSQKESHEIPNLGAEACPLVLNSNGPSRLATTAHRAASQNSAATHPPPK